MKGFYQNKKERRICRGFIGVLLVGVISFNVWGCGSDPGMEESPLIPTFAQTVFAPNHDTVFMQEGLDNKKAEILKIEVVAFQITAGGVVKAEFNVDYSGSVIRYDSFEEGNFLGGEAETDYHIVTSPDNPNRVTVTINRTVPGNGVFGDGLLIVLGFKLVGAGASQLNFETPKFYQQNGNELNSVQWFGGTVIVR